MVQVVKDVVTWLKQWFYTKDDLTPMFDAKANKNLTNANQNVVTDASGNITTEPKITDVSDLTDSTDKQFTPKSHDQATSTITNSTAFDNIKSGESTSLTLNTQAKINSAIDSKLAALSSIDVIKVVDSKPTASASTLNKLYIVSENNKVNVYYTKQSGSSYSWQKMDTDILDELSVSWNDIQNKPSFATVATSGSYNDLSNKPTIPSVTGKADKTAAIGTTITLVDKGQTNAGCIIFNTIS